MMHNVSRLGLSFKVHGLICKGQKGEELGYALRRANKECGVYLEVVEEVLRAVFKA